MATTRQRGWRASLKLFGIVLLVGLPTMLGARALGAPDGVPTIVGAVIGALTASAVSRHRQL